MRIHTKRMLIGVAIVSITIGHLCYPTQAQPAELKAKVRSPISPEGHRLEWTRVIVTGEIDRPGAQSDNTAPGDEIAPKADNIRRTYDVWFYVHIHIPEDPTFITAGLLSLDPVTDLAGRVIFPGFRPENAQLSPFGHDPRDGHHPFTRTMVRLHGLRQPPTGIGSMTGRMAVVYEKAMQTVRMPLSATGEQSRELVPGMNVWIGADDRPSRKSSNVRVVFIRNKFRDLGNGNRLPMVMQYQLIDADSRLIRQHGVTMYDSHRWRGRRVSDIIITDQDIQAGRSPLTLEFRVLVDVRVVELPFALTNIDLSGLIGSREDGQ